MTATDLETVTEAPVWVPPTVRIVATYPTEVWGCPDTVSVELNLDAGAASLGYDIRAAVQALAAVPAAAYAQRSGPS